MASSTQRRDITRDRIVKAAASLLRDQGPAAVTTRRVAHEAGLQPPALYRLFQDKNDLLNAAAEHVFAEHVASKHATAPSDDPVEDLRGNVEYKKAMAGEMTQRALRTAASRAKR